MIGMEKLRSWEDINIDKKHFEKNLIFLPPVAYFDMLELLKNCKLVMTDSGGLQNEIKNIIHIRKYF